ncbi:hypothetical protein [Candidatus Tisiphia endosymbiont of Myopa tessellatipennis]|uniref:hypothetical protein n=1 Tax=Candidatus Tisiphia endosymbiont of Myopa tessellatipennis TaxID=3066257 RepID=UPI00313C3B45
MTYTTTLPSEAIIFFDPVYEHPKDLKLRDDVITTSQQEGLTVVKIIESKGPYDHSTFGKLIRQVMRCNNKPVTILINENLRHTTINTLLWSVLGTLSSAGLITVTTYERSYKKVPLKKVNIEDDYFLYVAATYCKNHYKFANELLNI